MNSVREPLYAVQVGDGPGVPIVLSHALGLDHHMWRSTWERLSRQHPVLVYDHRGHGLSPDIAGPWAMVDVADDAAAVITAWGRGKVVFVGLSLGGMAAQGLGIRRPELLSGLVLAHTTARYPKTAMEHWYERIDTIGKQGMWPVVEEILKYNLTREVRSAQPLLVQALRERLLSVDVASYIACCKAVAEVDWLDWLSEIMLPTAVIAGANDIAAPVAMAMAIQERIPGATLEVLPKASHLGPIEQPAAFMSALKKFLDIFDPEIRVRLPAPVALATGAPTNVSPLRDGATFV